jgi:GLPGLI family protein
MEEVALEVVVVILVSADPGVIPMFVNVQIYQGNGEVIIKVVLKRVPLILIVVDMEVVDHFKIKINERWSKILDHLSISNRMKLLMFFIFFTYTQSFNSISMSAKLVFEEDNREVLDSAFFRLIYKVEQQALKEGDPFTVIDTMALDVGETWSVYYDLYRQYKDSIDNYNFLNNSPRELLKFSASREDLDKRLESRQEIYKIRNKRTNGESARIYKNRSNTELMTIDDGPMEMPSTYTLFRFTESIPPQNWDILEDTLTVLGHLCQKAITDFRGRSYTAWFTMELPVNEGPWKLYGLPGLILKAEDGEKLFCFQAIGLQDLSNTLIEIDRELKLFDRGRHLSIIKKIIGGNFKQWQAFRQAEFKKITVSFLDSDAISSYWMRNPIIYPEIEIDE